MTNPISLLKKYIAKEISVQKCFMFIDCANKAKKPTSVAWL